MRRQIALALALLFIAFGVPSNAQNAGEETRVTVDEGAPLTVECALRVDERADWRLDGRPVPADLRPAGEAAAGGRLTVRLAAPAARAQHAGAYTCAREPAQRVRVLVRALPGTTAPAAPSAAPEPAPKPLLPVVLYDVGRYFQLNCSAKPLAGVAVVWQKNDTAVENIPDLSGRYALEKEGTVFRLTARSTEDDFGNYTCALGDATETWDVRGRPHAKLPHNTNVVEKQTLKLTCKLTGKPYPAVTWTFSNATENATDVAALLGARVALRASAQGVADAELVLAEAARSDAGSFACVPAGGAAAATTLRVKDQYAALWPFLGICAEVFVLCAIILVYEKRRTKPELDDSDTDNHDQKKS